MTTTAELTQEEKAKMLQIESYLPYRIVFGVRESDGFHVYADYTKRKMNKFLRAGLPVFSFGGAA